MLGDVGLHSSGGAASLGNPFARVFADHLKHGHGVLVSGASALDKVSRAVGLSEGGHLSILVTTPIAQVFFELELVKFIGQLAKTRIVRMPREAQGPLYTDDLVDD
jgi:4-hydroxy-L-threonine phosphate dehydrogenase PdxA